MYKHYLSFIVTFLSCMCWLSSCKQQKKDNTIVIQASAVPQADLLLQIQQQLAEVLDSQDYLLLYLLLSNFLVQLHGVGGGY